tara:strand:+ start:110 stop:667 length:558 start_codon:yes stop_codon:yes gene_type:complete
MKIFTKILLSTVFVALIAGSVQYVTADHLEPDQRIYKDENNLNTAFSFEDSKYKIYMYVTVRNTEGELVSVAETIMCQSPISWRTDCSQYLDHEITDIAFDTSFGKKEIVTIDGITYEKVQFSNSYEQTGLSELRSQWVVAVCGGENQANYGFECAQIFQGKASTVYQEVGDITTSYWTILRDTN